jgi:hypothetical protein
MTTPRVEALISLCETTMRRVDAGELLTEEDLAATASLAYSFGRADQLKRTERAQRDRLAEIIADMHTRLDAGMTPTPDEITFAEILDERNKWVDTLREIQTHLEEAS